LSTAGVGTSADAVRFVPATPVERIVDNLDAGASSTGSWWTSGVAGFYGANSVFSTSAGSFTFPATLVPGTNYEVYGWWTAHASRNPAADYEIYNGAALLDTVTVDQRVNGGQWNLLGTYTFTDAGSVTVLSIPGVGTSADATRFVPVP